MTVCAILQGLPETQGAAAVALAHCYSQPVIVKPLFTSPDALGKKMAAWEMVADSANDAVPRVVHGGLVAVSRMIQKYLDTKSAREAGHTSDLQTVLGLMAWAGAVRLRVAGAHVLDRMDAMPASLKVLPFLCLCVKLFAAFVESQAVSLVSVRFVTCLLKIAVWIRVLCIQAAFCHCKLSQTM